MSKDDAINGLKILLFGPFYAVINTTWWKIIDLDPHTPGTCLGDLEKVLGIGGLLIGAVIACLLSILAVNFLVAITNLFRK